MTRRGPDGDPFFGHELLAKTCARFLLTDLACSDALPPQSTPAPPRTPPLDEFIAYALARTRYHPAVLFGALLLLARARLRAGVSAYRALAAGFLLASKVCCDDVYSLASWELVASRLFRPAALFAAELALCTQLDWRLHLRAEDVCAFEARVRAEHSPPVILRSLCRAEGSAAPARLHRARRVHKARATPYTLPPPQPHNSPPPSPPPPPPPPKEPAPHALLAFDSACNSPHREEEPAGARTHGGTGGRTYHYRRKYDEDDDYHEWLLKNTPTRRTGTVRPHPYRPAATARADHWLSLRHL